VKVQIPVNSPIVLAGSTPRSSVKTTPIKISTDELIPNANTAD